MEPEVLAAPRGRVVISFSQTRRMRLKEGRSNCAICLGSKYCCRHVGVCRYTMNVPDQLVCVCGRGCKL